MSAFKTKKIVSDETVGWKLRRARRKQKISIEKAEEKTKVRGKYLKAIEADDWKEFPNRIYVLGFVRRYSEFLGLDADKILSEFKQQFDDFTVSRPSETFAQKNLEEPKIIITPKLIYAVLGALAVATIIGYMIFAVNKFSKPPVIDITSPTEDVSKAKDIVIEGKTTSSTIIEINGQNANVEDDGSFTQKVQLEPGVNIFEIKAKSRLGKEKAKILRILYETDASPTASATAIS